ncbi:phosphopantetheine-binding protein [Streptomyces sp. NPDC005648]|uniref:phosphopantetheine-binding protein n=1 Tax=Streptomyces sp. NPDC005648 TaxID=3157044 RepID=UPI0033B1B7BD
MSEHWDESYEELLKDALPRLAEQGEVRADVRLKPVGLDSLATVEVLIRLENSYGIKIPDEELTPGVFDTPATLWALVERCRGGRTAA